MHKQHFHRNILTPCLFFSNRKECECQLQRLRQTTVNVFWIPNDMFILLIFLTASIFIACLSFEPTLYIHWINIDFKSKKPKKPILLQAGNIYTYVNRTEKPFNSKHANTGKLNYSKYWSINLQPHCIKPWLLLFCFSNNKSNIPPNLNFLTVKQQGNP